MQELELEQTEHSSMCMSVCRISQHDQKPQQLKQYECAALVYERRRRWTFMTHFA